MKELDFIELHKSFIAIAGKEERNKNYTTHIEPFLSAASDILSKKYADKPFYPHISKFSTHFLFRLGLDNKQTHRASLALRFGDDHIDRGFDLTHALGDAHRLRILFQEKTDEIAARILKLQDYWLWMPNAGLSKAVSIDSLDLQGLKEYLLKYDPKVMRECYCWIDRDYDETTMTLGQFINVFDQEYETFGFLMDSIKQLIRK
jgi:hypothetical protein